MFKKFKRCAIANMYYTVTNLSAIMYIISNLNIGLLCTLFTSGYTDIDWMMILLVMDVKLNAIR